MSPQQLQLPAISRLDGRVLDLFEYKADPMAAIHIRINAGAIVYRTNGNKLEVLLVHQKNKPKNLWSIPKGGVDHPEEFEHAARREVEEETNVKLGKLDFLGYVDYGKVNKRLYCFAGAFPQDAQVKPKQPEIDTARFFEITQAKKMVDKRQRALVNILQKILIFASRRRTSASA